MAIGASKDFTEDRCYLNGISFSGRIYAAFVSVARSACYNPPHPGTVTDSLLASKIFPVCTT